MAVPFTKQTLDTTPLTWRLKLQPIHLELLRLKTIYRVGLKPSQETLTFERERRPKEYETGIKDRSSEALTVLFLSTESDRHSDPRISDL